MLSLSLNHYNFFNQKYNLTIDECEIFLKEKNEFLKQNQGIFDSIILFISGHGNFAPNEGGQIIFQQKEKLSYEQIFDFFRKEELPSYKDVPKFCYVFVVFILYIMINE